MNESCVSGIPETTSAPALRIEIPEEILARMQQELILEEDVYAVIEHAVSSGVSILDERSGEHTAHLQIGKLTYWVCYLPPESTHEATLTVLSEIAHGATSAVLSEIAHGNATAAAPTTAHRDDTTITPETTYRVVRVYCHRMIIGA